MPKDYHTRHRFRIGPGLHYIGFWKRHPPWRSAIADLLAKKNIFETKLRKLG